VLKYRSSSWTGLAKRNFTEAGNLVQISRPFDRTGRAFWIGNECGTAAVDGENRAGDEGEGAGHASGARLFDEVSVPLSTRVGFNFRPTFPHSHEIARPAAAR
jgi:hypothetical protein